MSGRRRVAILGATGSVGRSTLDVLAQHRDRFAVTAVVGGRDAKALATIAREHGAEIAAIADPAAHGALLEALAGTGIVAAAGESGIRDAVARPADIVVAAIVGTAGLAPTVAAFAPGRRLCLANKECLVTAGTPFMRLARESGVEVVPLDSEHNAIFQALAGARNEEIEEVVLTASGGPFRTWTREAIAAATVEQALAHPNWVMGAKITIDSASLMNKGLELVEAHYLFDVDAARLGVLVHPQSAVHGLVAFRDGSLVAGLGAPDMRVPITNGLMTPDRPATITKRLDLAALGTLTFARPDLDRFPCLALARRALEEGGAMPAILNAANEVAVAAFLDRRIGFGGIAALVAETMERVGGGDVGVPDGIEHALFVDHETRRRAREALSRIANAGT